MRLVIPYRISGEGLELRYAIRSIQKHFSSLSGVLLIGQRPAWYTGDFIPFDDIKGKKELTMQTKILQAPDGVFLYSNDDFFALQDFNTDLPDYFDTTCLDLAERHPQADYREMYSNCLSHWKNFDIHCPMIMIRSKFKTSFSAMDPQGQTPIKTTYANNTPYFCDARYLADIKIRGEHSHAEIDYMIKDRPFFSTHESAINEALIDTLQNLYPDATDYERD